MQIDLIKEYEKEGNETISIQGTCKFCKQIATMQGISEWNQNQKDEAVTELCKCMEAVAYTKRKQNKERAYQNIEVLFDEKMEGYCITGEILKILLKQTVTPIFENKIKTVTIDTGIGIKAKISKSNEKDFVKVERIITKKQKME